MPGIEVSRARRKPISDVAVFCSLHRIDGERVFGSVSVRDTSPGPFYTSANVLEERARTRYETLSIANNYAGHGGCFSYYQGFYDSSAYLLYGVSMLDRLGM